MPAEPLLRVRDLSKTYFRRRWLAAPQPAMVALAGVSFTLERGRTLAWWAPQAPARARLRAA